MAVELLGYAYRVYSWIVRLALHEKGVDYTWVELNPFARTCPRATLTCTPASAYPRWLTAPSGLRDERYHALCG